MDVRSTGENSHGTNIILEREAKISIKKTTKIYVERKQTRVRQLHNSTARNHTNAIGSKKELSPTENNQSKQSTSSRAKRLQRTNFQLQDLYQRVENEIVKLEKYRKNLLSCQKKEKHTQSKHVETNNQSEGTSKEMTWRESLSANKLNTNNDEFGIKPRMRAVGLQEIKESNNTVTYNCIRLEQKLHQTKEATNAQREREPAGCTFGHSNQMQCSVYEYDYSANANCCNYQQHTCPHCSSQRYGGYCQQPSSAYQYCVTPTVCMPSSPPPTSPHCNLAPCYCPPTTRRCGTDLNTEDFCRNRTIEENVRNERSRSRSSSATKRKDKEMTRSSVSRAKSKSKSQTRQKPKSDERANKLLPQGLSDISSLHKYRVQNKEKLIKVTLKRASETSATITDNASSIQGMIITEYKSAAEVQAEDSAQSAAAKKHKTEEEKRQMYQDYLDLYKAEKTRKSIKSNESLIAMGPTPVSINTPSAVHSHESAAVQESGNVELKSDKTYSIIPHSETNSSNADNRPDVPQTRTDNIDPTTSMEQTHGDESNWEQKQARGQDYSNEYSDSYEENPQTTSEEKDQQQANDQVSPTGYAESYEEEPVTARQQQLQHSTGYDDSYKDQKQTNGQQPQQQAISQLYSRDYADSYGEQPQPSTPQQQTYNQQQPQISRQQQLQIYNPQQHITSPAHQTGQISSVTYIKQFTKIRQVEKRTQTEFDHQPLQITYCRPDCPREIFDVEKHYQMQCPCPRDYEPTYRTQPSYERRLSYSNQPRYEDQHDYFRYEDQIGSKQRPNHESPPINKHADQRNQLMYDQEQQSSRNRPLDDEYRRLAKQPENWATLPKPHDRTNTLREGSLVKYSESTENSQQMPNYDSYSQPESKKFIPQGRQISPGYVEDVNQPRSEDPTNSPHNQQKIGMPQTQTHQRSAAQQEKSTSAENLNYYHIENPAVMASARLVNLPQEECSSITSICKSYEQMVCTTTKRSMPCGSRAINGNEVQVYRNIMDRQQQPFTTEISPQLKNVNISRPIEYATLASSTNYGSVNKIEAQNGQTVSQTGHEMRTEVQRLQPKPPETQEYTMSTSKSTFALPEPVRSVHTISEQTMAKPITTEAATSTVEIVGPSKTTNGTNTVETQAEQTNLLRTKRRSVDFASSAARSVSNINQRSSPDNIQYTASAPSQYTLNHRQRGNPRYPSRQQMATEYRRYSSPTADERLRLQPPYRRHAVFDETDEMTYSSSSPSTPVTAYRRNYRGRPMSRQRSEQMSPNRRQSPGCRRNCEIVRSTETVVLRRSPIDWERCRQNSQNSQMPKHRDEYEWHTSDARPTSDYGSTEEKFVSPGKTLGSCSTLQTCRDSDYGDYMTCDESQGDDHNCKQLPEFKGCACMYNTYRNMAALCAPRQRQQAPNQRYPQIQDTRYAHQQHSFY